jgi:ribosomal protein S18 acetylase RimI-like enzyme
MRPQGRSLFVENVAVAPEEHGRGIGRSLLSFAERHGSSVGLTEVTLYTNEKMVENLRFYAGRAYSEVERRVADGFSRVYLRKPLE